MLKWKLDIYVDKKGKWGIVVDKRKLGTFLVTESLVINLTKSIPLTMLNFVSRFFNII